MTPAELAAQLREMLEAVRAFGLGPLAASKRNDGTAQVYATSVGPCRMIKPVAETTDAHATLICAILNNAEQLIGELEEVGRAHPGSGVQEVRPGLGLVSCNFCGHSAKHESWRDCTTALLRAVKVANANRVELALDCAPEERFVRHLRMAMEEARAMLGSEGSERVIIFESWRILDNALRAEAEKEVGDGE